MPDQLPTVQLIESAGKWTLRISASTEQIERLLSGDDEVEVAVSIRPNLVPGDTFTALAAVDN